MTTAAELASNIKQLASFPDVAFRIDAMVSDENAGASEFGAAIEADPALSVALLRIANSSLYHSGGEIGSVAQAVTVVGLRQVRDLAFGICAREAFDGIPNELITVEDFWKHSLYCATAAQSLATSVRACPGESLFTCGLLHDIGHLVMFNQAPNRCRKALQLSLDTNDGLTPFLSEREVFGFDHAAVGAELARQWQLPDNLRKCIEFHHEPFAEEEIPDSVLVVHAANSIAVLAELDSLELADAPPMDVRVTSKFGLDADSIATIVAESQEAVSDLLRIFVK